MFSNAHTQKSGRIVNQLTVAIKWKKKEEDSINEHFPYGLRSATSTNLQVPSWAFSI
jgi:hypothetical protein